MNIEEIRNNIKNSSSGNFINDIVDCFVYGNFINKKITSIKDLLNTSPNNMSDVNKEDYTSFVNGVLFKDYCKHSSIDYDAITDVNEKKRIVQEFIKTCRKGNKFSYDCSFLYNSNFDFNIKNVSIVVNVKGSEIYKVLSPLYEKLKESRIPCSIEVPLTKSIQKGYADSILINIPVSYLEEVVNLIHELPLPIINLINKPSMIYASINKYLGFDSSSNPDENVSNRRASDVLCEVIENSINRVVDEMITKYGNETFQDNVTYSLYREQSTNKLEANLQILYQISSSDMTYKKMLTDYIIEGIKQKNGCEYAYTNVELEKQMNMLFGNITDVEANSLANSVEVEVAQPEVSFESPVEEPTKETENYQIDGGIEVQSLESEEVKVDDNSNNALIDNSNAPEVQNDVSVKNVPVEEYSDGLVNPVVSEVPQTPEIPETPQVPEVGESKAEVTSVPVVNLEDMVELSNPKEENSLIAEKPQEVTENDLKYVESTLNELDQFTNGIDEVMNSLSSASNSENPTVSEDKELSKEEIASLSNNNMDQHMNYERALKYKDYVDNISILNSEVPGTDFKLLDYFDAQQIATKISPTERYKIYTDDIYEGRQFVQDCIIKYVLTNGNVPLEDVLSAYGAEKYLDINEQIKQKGLFGLFKKKSQ